jgi:hypothetical protein
MKSQQVRARKGEATVSSTRLVARRPTRVPTADEVTGHGCASTMSESSFADQAPGRAQLSCTGRACRSLGRAFTRAGGLALAGLCDAGSGAPYRLTNASHGRDVPAPKRAAAYPRAQQATTTSWYLFYTGASKAEHGLVQRIGLATSPDLFAWQHAGEVLVADPRWYETLDPAPLTSVPAFGTLVPSR